MSCIYGDCTALLVIAHIFQSYILTLGFPGGTSGKEPSCQCRRSKRRGFDSWVKKIPWRKVWQPIPLFLPGESHGQEEPGRLQSMVSQRVGTWWATVHGVTNSWTRVKQLSMYARRHPDFSSCVILGGVSNYSFFLPL